MTQLTKTNAHHPDFDQLVQQLNADLAARDGIDHPLAQFNSITHLQYVILAYKNGQAVGCGAIAAYDEQAMEVKRMYVVAAQRGQRIGEQILIALEKWAQELGSQKCVLFMGAKQPEAQQLYLRNGYREIEKYGLLKKIEDSICLAKDLK
ncbi:MAG: GNAT family N-acetyltransferase [Saprospiraceae bacterium]